MMKLCEISGSEPITHRVGFFSPALGMTVHVAVSEKSFRAVHGAGGIDQWLRRTPMTKMSVKAKRLKREIGR